MKNAFTPKNASAPSRGRLLAAAALALASGALAQPGSIDPAFNSGALSAPLPQRGRVLAMAVQPDQRILVGGEFITSNASTRNLARLHPDGTLDDLFNSGTGPNDRVTAIDL